MAWNFRPWFFLYKYTWCLFISSRFWYQFAVQHCLSCTSHIFVWRAFKDASVRTIMCDSFSYIFFWQVSCTTGTFILFIYTIASRLVLAVYICLYSQTIDSHLSTFKLLFCNNALHMSGLNKITKFFKNPLIKNNIIKREEENWKRETSWNMR